MRFQYSRQRASGYREQTAMRRDGLQGELTFRLSPTHTLSSTVFYTDLFYQTPGGLNKTQYDADPKQARPPSPVTRGAVEQQAMFPTRRVTSVFQMIFNGMSPGRRKPASMVHLLLLKIPRYAIMKAGMNKILASERRHNMFLKNQ